jgi:hypothetical protein
LYGGEELGSFSSQGEDGSEVVESDVRDTNSMASKRRESGSEVSSSSSSIEDRTGVYVLLYGEEVGNFSSQDVDGSEVEPGVRDIVMEGLQVIKTK